MKMTGKFDPLTSNSFLFYENSGILVYLFKLFSCSNSSEEVKALKNKGAPENDRGETGPLLIKEYFLDMALKELAGSVNDWYSCIDFRSDTISFKVFRSLPSERPNP